MRAFFREAAVQRQRAHEDSRRARCRVDDWMCRTSIVVLSGLGRHSGSRWMTPPASSPGSRTFSTMSRATCRSQLVITQQPLAQKGMWACTDVASRGRHGTELAERAPLCSLGYLCLAGRCMSVCHSGSGSATMSC